MQAEYARIPFADTSTYLLPDSVRSADAVMLADILPTSYEVGVLNGAVRPGDTVVIWAHRSAAMVRAMMGMLRAGAAFVALDPAYPAARLAEYVRIEQEPQA